MRCIPILPQSLQAFDSVDDKSSCITPSPYAPTDAPLCQGHPDPPAHSRMRVLVVEVGCDGVAARMRPPIQDAPPRHDCSTAAGEKSAGEELVQIHIEYLGRLSPTTWLLAFLPWTWSLPCGTSPLMNRSIGIGPEIERGPRGCKGHISHSSIPCWELLLSPGPSSQSATGTARQQYSTSDCAITGSEMQSQGVALPSGRTVGLCTVGAGMESSHDGQAGAIGRRETGRERMWVGEGKTGGLSPMCSSIYCTEGQDRPCLVPSTCPPLPLRSTNGLLIPCGGLDPVVILLIDNLLERDPYYRPRTTARCHIIFFDRPLALPLRVSRAENKINTHSYCTEALHYDAPSR